MSLNPPARPFSGTLSLEDPATRKGGGTVDTLATDFFGVNGAIVNDDAFADNAAGFGKRCDAANRNLAIQPDDIKASPRPSDDKTPD